MNSEKKQALAACFLFRSVIPKPLQKMSFRISVLAMFKACILFMVVYLTTLLILA